MRFEALLGSQVPDALRQMGYVVTPPATRCVIPHAEAEIIAPWQSHQAKAVRTITKSADPSWSPTRGLALFAQQSLPRKSWPVCRCGTPTPCSRRKERQRPAEMK
jgi:hypothetical protein